MIKAVIFDVDDTLYTQRQPFDRAFADLIEGKYDVDCKELYKKFKYHNDKIYHHYMAGEWDIDQVSIYRMTKAMEAYGYAYSEEECLKFQEAYSHYQQFLKPSDTVKEMLTYLKDRVDLGIITNGVSFHQRDKINTLGVSKWVPEEYILVSGETDYSKPDPRLFKVMEERMGYDTEEYIYVGDSLFHDMQGAKAAGWMTIYMNRRDITPNEEEEKNVDYMAMTEEAVFVYLKELIG